jgi:transcriptional regulator with XRE-family HTH domain
MKSDNIATMMKELREAADRTLSELAVSTGLSTSTIHDIERGKHIPQFDW